MPQWTGYMDGFLSKNLDEIKKVIRKDWDMVFIVDGREGSGKSALAQQAAKYCDPSLVIERIAFTPQEFKDAIAKAEKYQAVIYDEAYGGMSSRAALSEVNRTLVSMLAEIRQKNLFVFIVLPCFFELDKYAAIWRSCGLMHVYTGENFERGRFTFYNYDRKKDLYVLGKKFYSYNRPPPNFRGSFTAGYTVDDLEYRNKKMKALGNYDKNEPNLTSANHMRQRDIMVIQAYKENKTPKQIAALIGLTPKSIRDIINKAGIPKQVRSSEHTIVTNLPNLDKTEENKYDKTL